MQYVLFLPQMRLDAAAIVSRAQAAEAAGFHGIAFMDHLEPPLAAEQPMYEAFAIATWVAAHTHTLHVSHLVLCDTFRHPAVLARQCASLQDLSGGRFELGIGSGSWDREYEAFGVRPDRPADRTTRLGETLEVLGALWSGETVDIDGRFHSLRGAQQLPVPSPPIPVVIGGTGPRTMELVDRHAHWWNVPVHRLDRLTTQRAAAGAARVSVQQMVGFVASPDRHEEVAALSAKRFGYQRDLLVGDAAAVRQRAADLAAHGVERWYVWFTDFAPPTTLAEFGRQVIAGQ